MMIFFHTADFDWLDKEASWDNKDRSSLSLSKKWVRRSTWFQVTSFYTVWNFSHIFEWHQSVSMMIQHLLLPPLTRQYIGVYIIHLLLTICCKDNKRHTQFSCISQKSTSSSQVCHNKFLLQLKTRRFQPSTASTTFPKLSLFYLCEKFN